MTIDIDVDKLRSRQSELKSEIAQIDNLLLLADQFSKLQPKQLPLSVVQPAQPVPSGNANGVAQDYKRGFTPGLRRAVTLALHTGPTTESELARALAWEISRVRQVLCSMFKFHLCFLSEHGRITLSEEGKTQALWFIANPSYLTYNPRQAGAK